MNISFPFYCSPIYSILITLEARQFSFQHKRYVGAPIWDLLYNILRPKQKQKKKNPNLQRREMQGMARLNCLARG